MYTIKANRSTVHIAGIQERTSSTGTETGGAVAYYAASACGALTRSGHRMQNLGDHTNVPDAIKAAESATHSISGRKVCKTCLAAAQQELAALEATTDQDAFDADEAMFGPQDADLDSTEKAEPTAREKVATATYTTVRVGPDGQPLTGEPTRKYRASDAKTAAALAAEAILNGRDYLLSTVYQDGDVWVFTPAGMGALVRVRVTVEHQAPTTGRRTIEEASALEARIEADVDRITGRS
jgi:hypothetical protein